MPFDATPIVETDSETVRELRQARDLLAQGWCQGRSRRGHQHCLAGAIYDACGSDEHFSDAQCWFVPSNCMPLKIVNLLRKETVVGWNDARGRTHAEVLALMDEAIEYARKLNL